MARNFYRLPSPFVPYPHPNATPPRKKKNTVTECKAQFLPFTHLMGLCEGQHVPSPPLNSSPFSNEAISTN